MRIIYTKHAIDKLKTKDSKKFKITKRLIEKTIKKPISQQRLTFGVIRTVGELDKEHSLCVIFKLEDDNLKVITFFASEKGRYENKILS